MALLILKTWYKYRLALFQFVQKGQFSGTTTVVYFNSYLLLVIYKVVFISRLGSCFLMAHS